MSALMSDFLTIRPGTSLHTDESISNLTESVGGDSENGAIDSNDPIYVPSVDERDPTAVIGSTPTSLSSASVTNKVAPDLDSQDAFPALSSSSTPSTGTTGATWGTAQPSAPSINSVFSWGTAGPAKNKSDKKSQSSSGFPLESSAARASQSMEMLELPAAQVKASGRSIGEVIREVTQSIHSSHTSGGNSGHNSVEIEASTGRRSNNVTFLIRGRPSEVAQARLKLTSSFSPRGQLILNIPSSTRRFIIGTGGQTLKDIERHTGTKIQFPPRDSDATAEPNEDESAMVSVTITGDLSGVKVARERIEAIVSDRVSRRTITIPHIEPVYYRLLTPAKHEQLQQLINETNTRVRIPFVSARSVNDDQAESATTAITISGKSPFVENVEQVLLDIYKSLKQQMRSIVVVIPKALHRHIIGQRGATLQDIEERTGCHVEVPSPDEESEQVLLLGPEDRLASALEIIAEKTAAVLPWKAIDLTAAVHAPTSHILRVMQYLNHSQQLQQLEQEHHVHITLQAVPAGQPVVAEINGESAHQIHIAKRQLVELVKLVPTNYIRVEPFDPIWRQSIMGDEGSHCKTILDVHHVQVVLPNFNDTLTEMLFVYQPSKLASTKKASEVAAALNAAVAQVNAIKKETINFTRNYLDIPSHVYRQLVESREQLAQFTSTEFSSVSIVPDQSHTSQRRSASSKDHRVCIMGIQQEVDQVMVKLQQRIDEFIRQETLASYKTDIKIPNKYEPHIIGKKGANLNRIREQFGVKIDITEATEGENEFTVTVQGVKKHADGAIKELREMRERLADSVVQRIKVPAKLHPALIGPQGRYVRRLEENYQVRIQFPRGANTSDDDDEDGVGQALLNTTVTTSDSSHNRNSQAPDEVIISGGRKGVAEARAEMQELIEYEQARSYVVKLDVAARHLPFIMGKRGARINELRDETNTQIDIRDHVESNDMDASTSNDTRRATIAIQGEKKDVERARRRIEAIVNEQEDQCTLELDIPVEYHRQLIGAGGARIRDLVQQCGGSSTDDASMVRFPKPHTEDTLVVIRGQRAVAQKVYEALKALVEEQLSRHTLTLTVPTADRPTIIGQQGKTMKALESDYNVKIDLRALDESNNTNEEEAMTLVSISGEESNCEKARSAIQALVRFRETIKVARSERNVLQGRNSSVMQTLRRSYDVVLRRADSSSDPQSTHDRWMLVGVNADQVAAAKEYLDCIVGERKHQDTLVIPARLHRYAIGRGGSTVRHIAETTRCLIQFPTTAAVNEDATATDNNSSNSQSSSNDGIIITGAVDQVKQAKQMIEEAVQRAQPRPNAVPSNSSEDDTDL
ncbi:hypothetical protein BDF22DRAFT_744422 [Syncephalis plumigaleata]|nr:hypothetical protein BDF22DRAFT_744422 [Syncephalis plumigaleata]